MINIKERLVVIIPAYEPPREFALYARRVAELAMSLVVVNDGSGEEYNEIFDQIAAIPDTVVLSYPENHGKGYALKHAFLYCGEHYGDDTVLVTADCDGQHRIHDIVNVYKAAYRHPGALVLGSRNFDLPNVPPRSRAGNTSMCAMFRFFYGLSLYDTQTGLRGFSVGLSRELAKVKGDRFEYELAQLIHCKKEKIEILETPIDTVYPENPEEHVSHFRTIRDSLRVLGVMLSNLGWYLCSSTLSAVVDVLLFFILSTLVFPDATWYDNLLATVGARVVSSVVNFGFNYKYVFHGQGKSAILRYYTLWLCQLTASYGIVSLLSKVFSLYGIVLTLLKGVGDLCLALISYQIQQHWVFRKRDPKSFWGPLIKFLRAVARPFSRKYRCDVLPTREGAVYVCRHGNMHGPYTTFKWMKFDVHPMVLSVFFTKKECYEQYKNYTFSVRCGKKPKKFDLKAWALAGAVVPLVHSLGAIPVYRGTMKAVKTLKQSLDVLSRNESIIVYADKDYVGDGSGEDGIYEGFLHLGELYHRATGKSLEFIPIYIDEKEGRIISYEPVVVDKFNEMGNSAKEYIWCAINGTPHESSYLPPSMMLGREEQAK